MNSGVSRANLKYALGRNPEKIQFVYEFDISSVPDLMRKFRVTEVPCAVLVQENLIIDRRSGVTGLRMKDWNELLDQIK